MFNSESIPFQQMGFSKLWQDYQCWSPNIQPFFDYQPHNDADLIQKAQLVASNYAIDRVQLVHALTNYYQRIGLQKAPTKSLNRLLDPSTLTITTGQQLGLLGGPAFTLYKALTCILLAKKAAIKLGVDVVPVFWVADEDHDFEEIRKVLTQSGSDLYEFEIKANKSSHTVADIEIESEINQLFIQLAEVHKNDRHAKAIISNISAFYQQGNTHLQAFGQQMAWLLAELGMILVGSNDPSLKKLMINPLTISIDKRAQITTVLTKKSQELAVKNYPQQVQVSESLLFKIDEKLVRTKIDFSIDQDVWIDDTLNEYSSKKLKELVNASPHVFSPNVFLRPILQDILLPNIGYVAGPGELNYYAQTKDLYPLFGLQMPIIYPRISCTVIKSHLKRKITQLNWPLSSFKERPEKQAKKLIEQQIAQLTETDFNTVEARLTEELSLLKHKVLKELPNHSIVFNSVEKLLNKSINRLYSKYINAIKKNNSIELKRLNSVSNSIFPKQSLQERTLSLVSLLIEYGDKFPAHLLAHFEEINAFEGHLFIEVEQPSNH